MFPFLMLEVVLLLFADSNRFDLCQIDKFMKFHVYLA